MTSWPPKGLLLDLDGTVYEAGHRIPGVTRAVEALQAAGIPIRFVTNTTRRPRRVLVARLRSIGIDVGPEALLSAPLAAVAWLRDRGLRHLHMCVPPAALLDFTGFDLASSKPEAVVVGDLGVEWSFERLNQAFDYVMRGAVLVALHKNRYWQDDRGRLSLDAGPFVAALEYATGKQAVLVGKPSPAFFEAGAKSMGLALDTVAMVGDDLLSDVGGAQAAGAAGVLVRTGKWRPSDLDGAEVVPDRVIDSVANLPDLLLSD